MNYIKERERLKMIMKIRKKKKEIREKNNEIRNYTKKTGVVKS